MMKADNARKFILLLLMSAILFALTSCATYTCCLCGKQTGKAYYDYYSDKDAVMCEDCARTYWAPYDYKDFRVK